VGSAVVGAYAADKAGDKAARASQQGAATAADAQVQSTQMQIDEIRRQFDYQQQVLMPRIQQQYGAMGVYSDLLGITPASVQQQQEQMGPQAPAGSQMRPTPIAGTGGGSENYLWSGPNQTITNSAAAGSAAGRGGSVPISTQSSQRGPFAQGGDGRFIDPNLSRERLADTETLSGSVRDNLMAGTDAGADPYRNYIAGNRVAAPTMEEDARFARARDVTMAAERGGVTMAGERGGVSLADQRGGETMAGTRGNVSMMDLRGGETLADQRGGISLTDQRGDVRLAGDSLQGDEYYQDVAGRSLAAGAAGTGVYGEEFTASPGYSFAREEMERQLQRTNSAGGNFGGRAIMEAQRRSQGLANQEYYNWAAGRTQDLQRQAGAEAGDASRVDAAGANYFARQAADVSRGDQFAQYDIGRGDELARYDMSRGDQLTQTDVMRGDDFARVDLARGDDLARYDISRGDQFAATDISRGDSFAGTDIARGDRAVDAYRADQTADIARDDQAYMDYLRRREGDAGRLDSAAANVDRLRAADLARGDQAYYNYLGNVGRVAGFGDAAGQAVNASQAAGGQVAGAYAQQGNALSGIYQNLGANQAQLEYDRYANMNNAVQSGLQNYFTWQNAA
jgi:hypothetical protein